MEQARTESRRMEDIANQIGESNPAARLQGKRVLVTHAEEYMGPATVVLLREHGEEILADTTNLSEDGAVARVAEAARFNVQINLIAQNFVENPAYFPPAFTETPRFRRMIDQIVPLERLGAVGGLG